MPTTTVIDDRPDIGNDMIAQAALATMAETAKSYLLLASRQYYTPNEVQKLVQDARAALALIESTQDSAVAEAVADMAACAERGQALLGSSQYISGTAVCDLALDLWRGADKVTARM